MQILIFLLLMTYTLSAKDYTRDIETKTFIDEMVKKYSLKKNELETLFSSVSVQHSALRAFVLKKKQKHQKERRTTQEISKARKIYHKYGSWERYSRKKLNQNRVKHGVLFIKKYEYVFTKIEEKYGVPKEYIAAIIGIETNYGKNVGNYPVFDTLTTLAFEKNRRNSFFKKELEKFIHLAHTQKFNPKNVYGSYAGAIGLGQFMPSNYEAYGVDFNGDGRITLQRAEDAIASIANYLLKNGWRKGEPITTRVHYDGLRFTAYKTGYQKRYKREKLKGIKPREMWNYYGDVRLIKLTFKNYDELWYGTKNFFVITRYNHSAYYAMSIHQLAQKIRKKYHEH